MQAENRAEGLRSWWNISSDSTMPSRVASTFTASQAFQHHKLRTVNIVKAKTNNHLCNARYTKHSNTREKWQGRPSCKSNIHRVRPHVHVKLMFSSALRFILQCCCYVYRSRSQYTMLLSHIFSRVPHRCPSKQ